MRAIAAGALLAFLFWYAAPAAAQSAGRPSSRAQIPAGTPAPVPDGTRFESDVVIDGPPAPVAPDVITRDGGRATMRAIRLLSGIDVDGRLDEPVYESVAPVSDFIQQLPD